jgi:hypothetical protein
VIDAVGGGVVDSGAIAEGGGAACFLWQPEAASRATVATSAALFQNDVRWEIIGSSFVQVVGNVIEGKTFTAPVIIYRDAISDCLWRIVYCV